MNACSFEENTSTENYNQSGNWGPYVPYLLTFLREAGLFGLNKNYQFKKFGT